MVQLFYAAPGDPGWGDLWVDNQVQAGRPPEADVEGDHV